jgi:hypothetical protein
MGTRINVIVEHHVAGNYHDRAATIGMLAPTIPAAMAVAEYWRSVDPDSRNTEENSWTASPPDPFHDFLQYCAPGSLYIRFGPKLAVISTGGRWRGFLSIEPLRRVHLAAFRSIARVLGAKRLLFFADGTIAADLVPAVIDEGITQDECMARLHKAYGPPQPSVENIAPEIIAETERGVPLVWYVDVL